MGTNDSELYSLDEVSEMLNIPIYTIRYLFDSRKLKKENFKKAGKRYILFTSQDVQDLKLLLSSNYKYKSRKGKEKAKGERCAC